jgi:hypothetical protein
LKKSFLNLAAAKVCHFRENEASAVVRLAAAVDSFGAEIALELEVVSHFFAQFDQSSQNDADVFSRIDEDEEYDENTAYVHVH